jgi:hypothetical protein
VPYAMQFPGWEREHTSRMERGAVIVMVIVMVIVIVMVMVMVMVKPLLHDEGIAGIAE